MDLEYKEDILFSLSQRLEYGSGGCITLVRQVCRAQLTPIQERAEPFAIPSTSKRKHKACWETMSRRTQPLASALGVSALDEDHDCFGWMSGDHGT